MARLDAQGWSLYAATEQGLGEALALARQQRSQLSATSEAVEWQGLRCWYKHDRWRAKTSWRYALKRLLGLPLPRRAEFANLEWLRARCFLAAEPLVVGEWRRAGIPRYGFLITRQVERASTIDQGWTLRSPEERRALLVELARELARMHALRFVHRDVYARNLLVREDQGQGRIVFLDCWAGGPGWNWRSAHYDVQCLRDDAQRWCQPEEWELWTATYSAECAALRR